MRLYVYNTYNSVSMCFFEGVFLVIEQGNTPKTSHERNHECVKE